MNQKVKKNAVAAPDQKLKAVLRERLAELNAGKTPITAYLGDDYCGEAYAAAEGTRANSCFRCEVQGDCSEYMILRAENREKLKAWLEEKIK
jgi:hypothetical protein